MSRKKRKERRRVTGRERLDKHESGGSIPYLNMPEGANLFKPEPGRMLIDILEYEVGDGNPIAENGTLYYERTYFVHRGIGPNNDTYVCPNKTAGERCPVCEHRSKLRVDQDDEENEKLIYALKPSERQLFNVIDLKHPEKGVQIFDFSHWLFGKTLDAQIANADEDDGWENFASYEDGLSLRVVFAEDKFQGNSYSKVESIHFKPRKTEYDEDEMLEQVYCLDDVVKILPYKKLKEIFLQAPAGDDDDDDDDDEETPKARRQSSRKPSARDDADDDDDDDDEDEPKPRKKSKPAPKPDPDDDDDDDLDEDDEGEAKSPAKKSKPKSKPKKEEDWDDFDEDDQDGDDDEEEEPPAKKKAASKKKPSRKSRDDDDDDDDDDWD